MTLSPAGPGRGNSLCPSGDCSTTIHPTPSRDIPKKRRTISPAPRGERAGGAELRASVEHIALDPKAIAHGHPHSPSALNLPTRLSFSPRFRLRFGATRRPERGVQDVSPDAYQRPSDFPTTHPFRTHGQANPARMPLASS